MFANGGLLTFDVKALSQGMRITEQEVIDYFTDGRRVSFVMERRIAREVFQGKLSSSEGKAWDIEDENGDRWEVRSLSKKIYFCPSYMVGKGRKFDEPGFLQKLETIRGYAISDITLFPEVQVWLIEGREVLDWYRRGELGKGTHTSRARALKLFKQSIGLD
jgi:hypothetical protein